MEGKSDIVVCGKWMLVLMLSCLTLLHFGCSSGGGSDSSARVAQLKISTADTTKTAAADGQESYTITAQVLNGSGVAMNEQPVAFRAIGNKGLVAFKPGAEGITDADGTYTVTVTDISPVDDVFMVQATSGGKSASLEVRFFANQTPRYLALSLSQNTVKSDNSDSTEITATVLDANRAPIENITVAFQTMAEGSVDGGGQISASTASTDEKGEATIFFRSGTFEKKNQDVTIEAWIPAFPDQKGLRKIIPVEVSGTTVSFSAEKTNLLIDSDNRDRASAKLTISVRDAGGSPINNAEVIVEQIQSDGSAHGDVTITPSVGHTNLSGNFEAIVTGISSGNVNVLAKSMGAQVSQIFSVGKMGETFGIETPIDKPVRLTTQQCLEIKVRAPDAQWLRFATSLGSFVDSQCCMCKENSEICDYRSGCSEGEKTIAVNVDSNNLATVYLRSANPGIANVEVMDINNPIIKDTLTVAVVEPTEMAARLDLQASSTVVAPSTGARENTVTLHAMVRNDRDQPISGAPVTFSIENSIGGGERVSPVIVFTDEYGKATSIFTSGALSSGANGVSVKAEVIRNAGEPEISDTVAIVIGGTAASIAFGRGTVIESSQNDTMYELPMSLLVTDSNGNPISGAVVTLGAWPVEYATGYWIGTDDCFIVYEGWHDNEDKNRNLILDEGEDLNEDGQLTPPSSDAGSLPARVTTGENGSVDFVLTYPKASAGWIRTEISASTMVLGSETKSAKSFVLPWLERDSCHLPNAPYDPPKENARDVATIRISAPETTGKKADGQESYSVTAQILDSSNRPIAGFPINFVALNTNGIAVIDPPFGTSNDNGTVTVEVKYINSDIGNFTFSVRALSDDKTANITLSFTNVAEPVEENESQGSNVKNDSFYEPNLSKSLSFNTTNKGKDYNTYRGPSSEMGSHILKQSNFKIESSLWNMPGLAYGNRITQIIGYSTNDSIDPQLLEGMPVLFVAEPGLTIENGRLTLGAEGRAMAMGRTQILSIPQQTTRKEPEPMLMNWETELIEYVTNTYNKDFLGYPTNGLRNVSVYMNEKNDNSDKIVLADTNIILSGQPLILFDRDSFALGNGETAQVKVLICDENLNPLSPGTTVNISMNNGNLSGRVENTYQNSNVIGPDLDEHLKLIEYRLNISDPNPSINQYQTDTITVDVLWEGITIRSRLDGSIR